MALPPDGLVPGCGRASLRAPSFRASSPPDDVVARRPTPPALRGRSSHPGRRIRWAADVSHRRAMSRTLDPVSCVRGAPGPGSPPPARHPSSAAPRAGRSARWHRSTDTRSSDVRRRPPTPSRCCWSKATARVPELLPIRYGRMVQTPFTYYRGAARVMAADLSHTARSGLGVQMCGDAHLANFGFSGSPERRLVFDVNDFDETLPGPVRVRRQAAGGQPRGRRPGERLPAEGAQGDRGRRGSPVPDGDGGVRRRPRHRRLVLPRRLRRAPAAARAPAGRRPAEEARPRARQGADAGQPAGLRQAHRAGGRPAADPGRPAAGRAPAGPAPRVARAGTSRTSSGR